jgi:2,4-dienoyl-CoA reductase-like NADH-dependent reductase (Old Yellow Enzyme family)
MTILFAPLTIEGTTFRNRLWVSPMCQYSAVDGMPQDWHHVHLAQFATGGAGLVMAEATAVTAEGRISPDDTGLWNDAQREAWTPIVAAIHARGAAAGVQLAHAGRKASTWPPFAAQRGSVPAAQGGWQTVAPSAIAYEGLEAPVELDPAGIAHVIESFAAAAVRAAQAGFDVLEIHAAHGYLLHQFLSPLSNRRTDGYGGDLAGRARLLLEVVDAVRDSLRDAGSHALVFVRLSATDSADGGWDLAQTTTVARWAADHGAVLFDISSGGLVAHQRIEIGPGYQVPFSSEVRREAGVRTSAVGLIGEAAHAELILADGDADAVMAGREWLRDPHFALRASSELGVDIDYWPPQYLRARPQR